MPSALEISMADASLVAYGLTLIALLADHLLVGCRLLGLLVTVPGCNPSTIPWQLRALLLVVLAGIITPNVSLSARKALQPDGRQFVMTQFEDGNADAGSVRHGGDTPRNVGVFLGLAVGELGLGFLLGIGANLILQGFRMAGQLIDQQTGLELASSSGLDGEDGGSVMGELLFWMGNLLLVLLGGHLLLMSTLLETFRAFPPGCGSAPLEMMPIAMQMIQQSLSLALQLSAPVIAVQILVGLIVAHASSVAPQFQGVATGNVLKIAVALGVLTLALTGATERLMELIPVTQQSVLQAIHR